MRLTFYDDLIVISFFSCCFLVVKSSVAITQMTENICVACLVDLVNIIAFQLQYLAWKVPRNGQHTKRPQNSALFYSMCKRRRILFTKNLKWACIAFLTDLGFSICWIFDHFEFAFLRLFIYPALPPIARLIFNHRDSHCLFLDRSVFGGYAVAWDATQLNSHLRWHTINPGC